MPILPTSSKKSWISENKGNHQGRIRTHDDNFYHTQQWRNTRKRFLAMYPLCKQCEKSGIITPAKVLDHITPVKQGGAKFDFNNLQSLCDKCHASKSGKEANQ